MKIPLSALFFTLVCCALAADAAVIICNRTPEPVYLALSVDGDSSFGWWQVQPGECLTPPIAVEPFSNVYFYGVTPSGIQWQGAYYLCVTFELPQFSFSKAAGCNQIAPVLGFAQAMADQNGDTLTNLLPPAQANIERSFRYLDSPEAEQNRPENTPRPQLQPLSLEEYTNQLRQQAQQFSDGTATLENVAPRPVCDASMSCSQLKMAVQKFSEHAAKCEKLAQEFTSVVSSSLMSVQASTAAQNAALCAQVMAQKSCPN